MSESVAARQNIELKARLHDLAGARRMAMSLCPSPPETLRQRDTYFRCATGRLKLREIDGQPAQLIWYRRADGVAPRASDYQLVPVAEPAALRSALSGALGVLVEVEKSREVFLYENVRIHLDDVRWLGTFLEFEAVLDAPHQAHDATRQVRRLAEDFGLAPGDLVPESYSDLIACLAASGDAR